MQQTMSWSAIIQSSLSGTMAAWLCVAVVGAVDTYAFQGPSDDIAMAFFPAAIMVGLVAALLLFWPLTIGMARLGVTLGQTQKWARNRWGWAAVGALMGSIAFGLFIGVLNSWSGELVPTIAIGAGLGAAAALVTYWRLGVGRLA
jgi:hypothetical protein